MKNKSRKQKKSPVALSLSAIAFLLVFLLIGWVEGFMNQTCTGIVVILIIVLAGALFRELQKNNNAPRSHTRTTISGKIEPQAIKTYKSANSLCISRLPSYDPEADQLWKLRYVGKDIEKLKQVVEIVLDNEGFYMTDNRGNRLYEVKYDDILTFNPDLKTTISTKSQGNETRETIAIPPWVSEFKSEIDDTIIKRANLEKHTFTDTFRNETIERSFYGKKQIDRRLL